MASPVANKIIPMYCITCEHACKQKLYVKQFLNEFFYRIHKSLVFCFGFLLAVCHCGKIKFYLGLRSRRTYTEPGVVLQNILKYIGNREINTFTCSIL